MSDSSNSLSESYNNNGFIKIDGVTETESSDILLQSNRTDLLSDINLDRDDCDIINNFMNSTNEEVGYTIIILNRVYDLRLWCFSFCFLYRRKHDCGLKGKPELKHVRFVCVN